MEAAFFDLDKTVIAKASMVAFGRPLLEAGMISRLLLVRALWSQIVFQSLGADEERMRKFRESALRITKGWDQARVSALVRDSLADVIEPIVYDEALELIREHRAAGRRVFIVSASPEEIVVPLGIYLGVDDVIASRARLDSQGRYTGEVELYCYGPYKAEAMRQIAEREGIDLERSFAYSDSITDLPMLETVGNPVAVNPDRELARIARERGWEIQRFRIGVPLRERVSMPPPRATVTIAAAALVGSAMAGATWWALRRRAPAPPPSGVALAWKRLGRLVRPTPSLLRTPAASSPRTRRGRPRR
ncbi:MAG: HAD-IB family hydrolase [Acidimicrobiales bacterium]